MGGGCDTLKGTLDENPTSKGDNQRERAKGGQKTGQGSKPNVPDMTSLIKL